MTEFLAGIVGVAVGAVIALVADLVRHWYFGRPQKKLDDERKAMLKELLENPPTDLGWRKLSTLSRVIGADYETTTRLLIEMGARGSTEKKDVWALKSKKPLTGVSSAQD